MKVMAVIAWPPRKTGVTKASPMKPPRGSTSSLIMVATSAWRTFLKWATRKRSTRSVSSKRRRRSMRSPRRPFSVLTTSLNTPLTITRNRKVKLRAKSRDSCSRSKPWNRVIGRPKSASAKGRSMPRNDWVLPGPSKPMPVMPSLMICLGSCSEKK